MRAEIDFGSEDLATTFETTLTATDLAPLFAALLNNPNVQVTGRATGTIRASGTLLPSEDAPEDATIADAISGRAEFWVPVLSEGAWVTERDGYYYGATSFSRMVRLLATHGNALRSSSHAFLMSTHRTFDTHVRSTEARPVLRG